MSVLVVDGETTVPTALVHGLGVISGLVTLGVDTAVDMLGIVMVMGVLTDVGVETVVGVATVGCPLYLHIVLIA